MELSVAWAGVVASGPLSGSRRQPSINEKLFELCYGAQAISAFEAVQKSYLGVLCDSFGEDFKIRRVLESETLPIPRIPDTKKGHSTYIAQGCIFSSVLLGRPQRPLALSSHPNPGSDSISGPLRWTGD